MKKVLSIVLAVMMLSTLALAAPVGGNKAPGDSIKVPANDANLVDAGTDGTLTTTAADLTAYGDKLKEKDWTVSKVTWDEGRTLVKSVSIDDKMKDSTDAVIGGVKISLKEDYKLVKESNLEGTVLLREKTAKINGATMPNPAYQPPTIPNPDYDPNATIINPDYDPNATIPNPAYVDEATTPGVDPTIPNPDYDPNETIPNPDYDPAATITNPSYDPSIPATIPNTSPDKGKKVYIGFEVKAIVTNADLKIVLDSRDDEVTLNEDEVANTVYTVDAANGSGNLVLSGDDFEFSNKVYDGEKLFLEWDYDYDDAVLQANDDVTGDITFLNFVARPSFSSANGKFIFDVEKDYHIYENKDGKLTELKAKWSDDDNGLVVTGIKTLGSYVISENALKSASASAGETPDGNSNPDTGANDIVGIATALAAVALVSAAAVSLKK